MNPSEVTHILAVISYLIVAIFTLIVAINIIKLRVVVSTNQVHIVQSGRKTTSYGKDMGGNTYYRWPAWIPGIGVRVSVLPLSVFRVELENYAAYDKGRLPFVLDVLAFFRIADASKAAERLSSITELDGQLQGIMQGVVRTILANAEIEDILGKRAEFSEAFTKEVEMQLPQWGIETVKNIELMDIRDGQGSQVIANIMAKKKSQIEMESRVEVAKNGQTAAIAEVNSQQAVEVRKQEAMEQVGMRSAQKDQQIGIQTQKAQQAIKDEEKATAEKQVAVQTVSSVGQANIDKSVQIVRAEQAKQVQILGAEGMLEANKRAAEGVKVQGDARGAAETALQMATVTPQISLAKEIGSNPAYQTYLLGVKQIEAGQVVGIEQAKALATANIKVIANSGSPVDGVKNVMDLFTPRGGTQIGAALEALSNTETGAKVLSVITGDKSNGVGGHA